VHCHRNSSKRDPSGGRVPTINRSHLAVEANVLNISQAQFQCSFNIVSSGPEPTAPTRDIVSFAALVSK
jgi:hypothetical protein